MSAAPETFGPYRLLRRLAFGGMAEIFLASMDRDRGFEKRVVLKRILPQFSADAAFVQMFIDEAVVAGRLSHPNIVQVYDFGNVDGQYFIAMEHIDGADLRQLLKASDERGERLGFAEVAAIGEAVARGLAYAHALTDERLGALGIVHRDVTPHNIMVSRAGDVKVMDFGIAKAAARATRTATGVLKGKVAYMAPEQAAGHHVDARADQFALGVVLWECLSGRRLFEGGSDLEMLQRVLACAVPPMRDVRRDVPPPLAATVMRCLAKERDERWADMAEVEQELAAFRYSLGTRGAVRLGDLVERLTVRWDATPARRTLALDGPGDDGSLTAVTVAEPAPTLVDGPQEASLTTLTERAPALERPTGGDALTTVTVAEPACVSAEVAVPARRRRSWMVALGLGVTTLLVATLVLIASGTPTTEQGEHARLEPLLPPAHAEAASILIPARAADADASRRLAARPRQDRPAPREPQGRAARAQQDALTAGSRQAAPVATGWLSLRSAGAWVDVSLGARKLGTTPLHRVVVPAGVVRLRLVNREAGIDEHLELEIAAGTETRRTIRP